jgi:hypothetical protein
MSKPVCASRSPLTGPQDILIWSATSMKWVEVKMRELGVSNNPNYKVR